LELIAISNRGERFLFCETLHVNVKTPAELVRCPADAGRRS